MVFYRERENGTRERPPLSLILPHLYLGAETDVTQVIMFSFSRSVYRIDSLALVIGKSVVFPQCTENAPLPEDQNVLIFRVLCLSFSRALPTRLQDCLGARGISYVLSMSRYSPQPTFLPRSQYLRIPIEDSLRDDLLPHIPEALRFIGENNDEIGLVWCQMDGNPIPHIVQLHYFRQDRELIEHDRASSL